MKVGDILQVTTKEGDTHSGLLIPCPNKNIVTLKLDSGYNLSFKKNKIKSSKVIGKPKTNKETIIKSNPKNPRLKKIVILHVGGTFASKVGYSTGGVESKFDNQELLNMFPELNTIANIESKLMFNLFSEDMNFNHYNSLANEIEKQIKNGTDGVIITQGTDTLVYTGCALTFILENLNIPVILVGSQRSSDRGSSDAALNIICAAQFIVKSDFNGVGLCMHENSGDKNCLILNPLKSKKLHTSRRDAFKPVNGEPLAKIDKNGNLIFVNYTIKKSEHDLVLKLLNPKLKIGILVSHPNISSSEIKLFNKFNGLILDGTGIAGNFPINKTDKFTLENKNIYNELKKLGKKMPLFAVSQCIFGRVNMNVYSTGRLLQEANIQGNMQDLTLETAYIKLAWLLSNYKLKQVKTLLSYNLKGEVSDRLKYKEDFLG